MSFPHYTSPQEVIAGIQSLDYSQFPESIRSKFVTIRASEIPVEMMVKMGEFIYAKRSLLPEEVLLVGAGVISFCTNNGFWGLKENGRGSSIIQALLKAANVPHPLAIVGGTYPDDSTFPAVYPEFA